MAQSLSKARHAAFVVICLHLLLCAVLATAAAHNPVVNILSNYILALLICAWVQADARLRRKDLWYDYDTFTFFAWPFLTPIYLFQTRGLSGLVPMLIFGVVWLAALALGRLLHS